MFYRELNDMIVVEQVRQCAAPDWRLHMSKIICDICGTTYPDTAQQCPICGSARSAEERIVPDENQGGHTARESSYTYVKGGRFSKSNVKKRNKAMQKRSTPAAASGKPAKSQKPDRPVKQEKERKNSSNRVLIIIALCLLLAIVAVAAFIVFRFFWPFDSVKKPAATDPSDNTSQTTESTGTMEDTTVPEDTGIACTGLTLSDTRIDLDAAGRAWLIEVTAEPADTTDTITFASSDDRVATVSDQGRVTAVGSGQAVITITCGNQTAQCRVICDFESDTTEPSETTKATDPTETTSGSSNVELSLNRSDITFAYKGESFEFEADGLSNSQITWSVNNTDVATVSNGVVTAVGPGMTTLVASYKGQTAECIIRCDFPADSGEDEGGPVSSGSYSISHSDVTIAVGESFGLYLYDGNGSTVSVSWSVGDGSVCSVSGNTVTGLASGDTTVYTTYNGTTYSCIVRVG